MLQKIASCAFYEIIVDTEQNLVILEFRGFWGGRSNVPEYVSDCKKALAYVQPGFNTLVDLTKTTAISEDAATVHTEVQKLFKDAGLARVAEVYRQNDPILEYQLANTKQTSGIIKRVQAFTDRTVALEWLRQPAETNVGVFNTLKKWFRR